MTTHAERNRRICAYRLLDRVRLIGNDLIQIKRDLEEIGYADEASEIGEAIASVREATDVSLHGLIAEFRTGLATGPLPSTPERGEPEGTGHV